jgi:hypothetical protein
VGRVRYSIEETLNVSVPSNVSGTFDFDLMIDIEDRTYRMTVVVLVPEKEEPEVTITSQSLVGEGSNIFFIVEATGVPDDGIVKGRVLPCNYGEGASCGIPQTYVLAWIEDGMYRASVQNLDLMTYTHLTYNAWVEVGGVKFAEQEEVQVEISSLVEIESDDDEEDDDSIWPLLVFVISIVVLIVIIVVIIVIARSSMASGVDEEIEETQEEEPIPEPEQMPPEKVQQEEVEEGETAEPPVEGGSPKQGEPDMEHQPEIDGEEPVQGGTVESELPPEPPFLGIDQEISKSETPEGPPI